MFNIYVDRRIKQLRKFFNYRKCFEEAIESDERYK